jgi:murein L,D-transpeptidase YcbB/YkuD
MHFKAAAISALAMSTVGPAAATALRVTRTVSTTTPPSVCSDAAATEAAIALRMCSTTYERSVGFFIWRLHATYPSTSATGGDCLLYPGAPYAPVRALQETLNTCYSAGLVLDGIYGPLTTNAVKRAQAMSGLPQTGTWGPPTGNAMTWRGRDERGRFRVCVLPL